MVGFVEAPGDINDPTDDYIELVDNGSSYLFYLRSQSNPIEAGSFYRYREDGVDLAVGGVGIKLYGNFVGPTAGLEFDKSMYEIGEVVASVNYKNATYSSPIIKYNTYNGYQLAIGPLAGVEALRIDDDGVMTGYSYTSLPSGAKAYVDYVSGTKMYTGYGNYFTILSSLPVWLYDIV